MCLDSLWSRGSLEFANAATRHSQTPHRFRLKDDRVGRFLDDPADEAFTVDADDHVSHGGNERAEAHHCNQPEEATAMGGRTHLTAESSAAWTIIVVKAVSWSKPGLTGRAMRSL